MPNSFTPQQIEQFLQEFFDVVGARQYIGARYVPIFGRAGADTVAWDDLAPYEPLTVVMHQGVSYVSRRYVPTGIPVTDTDYWVETYRFNAQVEQYRQQVLAFDGRIEDNATAIADEAVARQEADDHLAYTLETEMADTRIPWPDATTWPKYGTADQVLATLADGGTKWVDPVTVDAEIAEPLIESWLDAHPEATTTVQDGSITNQKIANGTIADAKLVQSGGVLQRVARLMGATGVENVTPSPVTGFIQYNTVTNKLNFSTPAGSANFNHFSISVEYGETYAITGSATADGTIRLWQFTDSISGSVTPIAIADNLPLGTYLVAVPKGATYLTINYRITDGIVLQRVSGMQGQVAMLDDAIEALAGKVIHKTATSTGFIYDSTRMVAPYDDFDTFPDNEYCAYQTVVPAHAPDGVSFDHGAVIISYNPTRFSLDGQVQILKVNHGNAYIRMKWANGWMAWKCMDNDDALEGIIDKVITDTRIIYQQASGFYYYDDTTNKLNLSTPAGSENLNHVILPVEYGELYLLSATSSTLTNARLWSFTAQDTGGTVTPVSIAPTSAGTLTDEVLTVPYGSKFMEINFMISGGLKLYRISNLKGQFQEIRCELGGILDIDTIMAKPLGITSASTWTFVGDSITQGYTGEGQEPTTLNWVVRLVQGLGCSLSNYENRAIGGALYTTGIAFDSGNVDKAIINQLQASAIATDFLVVSAGTNDFGEHADPADFLTDMNAAFDYIDQNFSGKVVVCTPIRRTNRIHEGVMPLEWYAMQIFREAMCRGYSVVNGFELGFPSDIGDYQGRVMPDGLHPSKTGYQMMGNAMLTKFL